MIKQTKHSADDAFSNIAGALYAFYRDAAIGWLVTGLIILNILIHLTVPAGSGYGAMFWMFMLNAVIITIFLSVPRLRAATRWYMWICAGVAYPVMVAAFYLHYLGLVPIELTSITRLIANTLALGYLLWVIHQHDTFTNNRGLGLDLLIIFVGLWAPILLWLEPEIVELTTQHGFVGIEVFLAMAFGACTFPVAFGYMVLGGSDLRTIFAHISMSIGLSIYIVLSFMSFQFDFGANQVWINKLAMISVNVSNTCTILIMFHRSNYRPVLNKRRSFNPILILGSAAVVAAIPLSLLVGRRIDRVPSVDAIVLAATIATSVLLARIFVLLANEVKMHRKADLESITDDLTGLLNRRGLQRELSTKNIRTLAMLQVDIEDFKAANEYLGHKGADGLLIDLGNELRRSDALIKARIGGDEFVAVFDAAQEDPRSKAETLVRSLCGWKSVGSNRLYVSCTGVLTGTGHADIDTLFRAADKIMYIAKQDQLGFLQEDLVERRSETHRQLNRQKVMAALDAKRMPVHLQPIYALDGELHGFEALARLQDPQTNQVIAPDKFLQIIDRQAMHGNLTRSVVASLHENYQEIQPYLLGLNIDPKWLCSGNNSDLLVSYLVDAEFRPESVMLELSLSALNAEKAAEIVNSLSMRGFNVALDEFGENLSHLSLLEHLNIDAIKIERSLLDKAVAGSPSAFDALKRILESSNAKVYCVGVSSAAHLRICQAIGARYIQGNLLGRAVPIAELAAVPRRFNVLSGPLQFQEIDRRLQTN
ncbi:MAG: EAL domain-containing protein [Gammaproteobacteria bacterium]|nr:EAL domain-containing protein [Gammaproteobacteria bacterium]